MLLRDSVLDGRADLPNMVHRRHFFRQLHGGENSHHPVRRRLRAGVQHRQRELLRRYGAVGSEIVSFHGDFPLCVLEGDEGLRSDHAGAGGVYPPGDPPVGGGRRRHEGDGERGFSLVICPVEKRFERREIGARVVVAENGRVGGRVDNMMMELLAWSGYNESSGMGGRLGSQGRPARDDGACRKHAIGKPTGKIVPEVPKAEIEHFSRGKRGKCDRPEALN
nr:hypothetical protein Iba_chr07fCG2320 [Ipomoea batatas]